MSSATVTAGTGRVTTATRSADTSATRYLLLDAFRGLAALWVFTFHYPFGAQVTSEFPAFRALAAVGDLGVVMFFVLSGYCITAAARAAIATDGSTSGFVYRRLRRIYPPYWLSILVVAALPFLGEALSWAKTGVYVAPSPVANDNNEFLTFGLGDWLQILTLTRVFAFPDAADLQSKFTALNAVYWSLAIEVQFYLVVALALVYRTRFYLVLGLVTCVSIPAVMLMSPGLGIFLPYWPLFAFGILVYWVRERGWSPSALRGTPLPWASAALSVTMIALFCWVQGSKPSIWIFAVFFALLLLAAEGADVLFANAQRADVRVVRWGTGLLITLGAMSYSLYLIHARFLYLSRQVTRQVLPQGALAFDIAAFGLTLAVCYAFYVCCERPFVRAGRRSSTVRESFVPDAAIQSVAGGISR